MLMGKVGRRFHSLRMLGRSFMRDEMEVGYQASTWVWLACFAVLDLMNVCKRGFPSSPAPQISFIQC